MDGEQSDRSEVGSDAEQESLVFSLSRLTRRTMVVGAVAAGLAATFTNDWFAPLSASAIPSLAFGYPCDEHSISDNWQAHRNRGSAGGTDYKASYGSDVRAMADGVISFTKNSTSDGTGRYIEINHGPMGSYSTVKTQSLHLSAILVSTGQSVARGQLIAKSGASAYGSETGTQGAHLHISGIFDGSNLDIQNYVGLEQIEDDMTPEQWQRLQDVGTKVSQNADALAALTAQVQTLAQYLLTPRTEPGVSGPSTVDRVALTGLAVDRIAAKLGA
ncbi:M23 family metallopeptidase [Agreia pratensis]|uniref:M23 family metallopeptidase n=1 Tax=Agreia pratensis TaxID=150121 RepID=UPI00188BE703|nr:M23 family metallopeptidase [Agreia pratensis]MBF4634219.1 M23 family metallopeptidase [Agreia pratensis]